MTRAEEDAMETPTKPVSAEEVAQMVAALLDKDAMVLSGLFHCGPVMQQAAALLQRLAQERDAVISAAGKEAAETEIQHNRSLAIVGRELAEAKAAAAKAREDAERYRWLRSRQHKNNRWPYVDQHRFMPNIDDPNTKVPQLWDDSFPHKYHPENLDAAIDAAREQTAVPQSS